MTRTSLDRITQDKLLVEEMLRRQTALLSERVKELECLRAISRLFDRKDLEVGEIIRRVVEVIPAAWQYPEVTEACITLGDDYFTTPGFRETPWRQSAAIVVHDESAGALTVCYLEERPQSYEGPFLREERELLDMIVERLGGYIERARTLRSLLCYQEDLRYLASALSLSEQRERRRIAEGLHDHIGQNLALVNMRLSAIHRQVTAPETALMIDEARELISAVIAETRTLTFELYPPMLYELGLGAALDWLAEQFEKTYGLRVAVREHGDPAALTEDVRVALFQAAREILTNTGRHAQATTVNVDIFNGDHEVRVLIEDNGIGFDVSQIEIHGQIEKGFGLFNIRERLRFMGGTLELKSESGRGTTAQLTLPCAPRARVTKPEQL